jgi:hypothetical protein
MVPLTVQLFDDFFFQPAPHHDQPIADSPPTKNKRPRGRLKFEYVAEKDENIFELIDRASWNTWDKRWINIVRACLALVFNNRILPQLRDSKE